MPRGSRPFTLPTANGPRCRSRWWPRRPRTWPGASAASGPTAPGWCSTRPAWCSDTRTRRRTTSALYTTLFDLLGQLGYFRATAGITLPNAASVGLHEAFGFTVVGVYRDVGYKLGAWHDVAWYQADLRPIVPNPAEPRPMSALTDAPAWAAAMAKGLAHYVDHS